MKQIYMHPTTRMITLSTEDCTMQITSFGMNNDEKDKITEEKEFDTRQQSIWDNWKDEI